MGAGRGPPLLKKKVRATNTKWLQYHQGRRCSILVAIGGIPDNHKCTNLDWDKILINGRKTQETSFIRFNGIDSCVDLN